MTNNELITELLKYDGWEYESEEWDGMYKMHDAFWYKEDEHIDSLSWEDANTYLTDMNILHRLAVKVKNNIRELLDKSDDTDWELASCATDIIDGMFKDPNEQGEHIQLATAIVNAIKYIQNESTNRL